ncbi:CDP-alcohol phosphatidyltransferase family protein [Agrobacterium fabrum]|uniref:CDP-alcohol phosphatidyltransferase family protein n=1 Tax=Agrobacterium fabrum TaxID=1176649 RepID=UPI003BA0FBE6
MKMSVRTSDHHAVRTIFAPANLVSVGRAGVCLFCLYLGMAGAGDVPLFVLFVLCFWPGDSLDGYVARKTGTASPFGAAVDLAVDRSLDCVCAVTIAAVSENLWPVAGAFLVLRIVPSCVGLESEVAARRKYLPFLSDRSSGVFERICQECFQGVRAFFFGGTVILGYGFQLQFILLGMCLLYLAAFAVRRLTLAQQFRKMP